MSKFLNSINNAALEQKEKVVSSMKEADVELEFDGSHSSLLDLELVDINEASVDTLRKIKEQSE